jgi:hypothetical protein
MVSHIAYLHLRHLRALPLTIREIHLIHHRGFHVAVAIPELLPLGQFVRVKVREIE